MRTTRRIQAVEAPIEVPVGCVEVWGLTPRQAEVLHCLCAGMANKDIAARLGISLATAVAHVSAILRNSGSDSRSMVLVKVMTFKRAAPESPAVSVP